MTISDRRNAFLDEMGLGPVHAITPLLIALASPIDLVSGALFSVHMVQHLLIVLVAGPLLAYARPELALLWALPAGRRRGLARWWVRNRWLRTVWRGISAPAIAWAMHAVALWAWHTPKLYDAAVRTEAHLHWGRAGPARAESRTMQKFRGARARGQPDGNQSVADRHPDQCLSADRGRRDYDLGRDTAEPC